MRKTFLLFFTFCISVVFGQTFSDSFDDDDIAGWGGDVVNFIANGTGQLQLQGDCASGGENYLSAEAATLDTAMWEFFVDLDFDPSGSNYTKVYLQSDNADLSGSLNGYYIRIGEDGSADAVKLYRQEGLSSSLILTGISGEVAVSPTIRIRVVRTMADVWNVYADPTGGTSYVLEGTVTDAGIIGGNFTGVYCKYSSTRCDAFYYDDFFVSPLYTDIDPPVIASISVLSSKQVELTFTENVEESSAENNAFYAVDGGVGNPLTATRNDADNRKVILTFAADFPDGVLLNLTVSGVEDAAGNVITTDAIQFLFYTIKAYEVVIHEIMADPEPVVSLPNAEYIELHNTTELNIDLTGWAISDATDTSGMFPSFLLQADSFVIITNETNSSLFTTYGQVLGISNFPSLNNDGDFLRLFDKSMHLIHSVNYSSVWYQNAIKEDGGYALEMIDQNNPCQGENNWIASIDAAGGTPGATNSVKADNPDEIAPALMSAYIPAPDSLYVFFDEAINLAAVAAADFSVDNGIGSPAIAETNELFPDRVKLYFASTFSENVLYTVTCNDIIDCSGNEVLLFNTAQFGIAVPADSFDIVINEILFNPVTDGYDFVELYNRSDKFIDLSSITLAEYDLAD
ncbi:MAG: lamin tail domain-containing protein, partial [Chitinophagales bacterium]|nr:lamin tail domain-containing protein [Chitinophagales bacterium]